MKKKHLLPFSFFIMMFLYHFSSGFAHPVTPTLIVDRGLPSQWYGYAMSAVSVGCFVIAPFWGKLCNYISTKRSSGLSVVVKNTRVMSFAPWSYSTPSSSLAQRRFSS